MKRAVAAVLAIVFLASSAWSFANGDAVEEWLIGQVNTDSSVQTDLVRLQDDEQWLVVVVDFDQHTAANGWGTALSLIHI